MIDSLYILHREQYNSDKLTLDNLSKHQKASFSFKIEKASDSFNPFDLKSLLSTNPASGNNNTTANLSPKKSPTNPLNEIGIRIKKKSIETQGTLLEQLNKL